MLATDVVKKASEQGMKLTAAYVHTVRYINRRSQKDTADTAPRRGPGRPKRVEVVPAVPAVSSLSESDRSLRLGRGFSYGVRRVTPPPSSANILAEIIDKLVETRVRALFAELAAELRS